MDAAIEIRWHPAILFFEDFVGAVAVVVEDEAVVVVNDFRGAQMTCDGRAVVEVEDGVVLDCPGAFEVGCGCKANFSAAVRGEIHVVAINGCFEFVAHVNDAGKHDGSLFFVVPGDVVNGQEGVGLGSLECLEKLRLCHWVV